MQTATNPQTGEKVMWNGAAWVPAGPGAAPAPAQGPFTVGTPHPKSPPPQTPEQAESAHLGLIKKRRELGLNDDGSKPTEVAVSGINSIPEGDRQLVQALIDGRVGISGSALKDPQWQRRMQWASQIDPSFDMSHYQARVSGRKALETGKLGASANAFNTMIEHAGLLAEQSKDVPGNSGGLGVVTYGLNKAENWLHKGDPGLTNFKDTAGKLSAEQTSVYRNGGGAEADVQRFMDSLDPNLPLDAKEAVIKNTLELAASKAAANYQQYSWAFKEGKPTWDMLSPQALATLRKYAPEALDKHFYHGFAYRDDGSDAAGAPGAPDGPNPPAGPQGGPPPGPGLTPSTNGYNETPDPQSSQFWEGVARQGMPYRRALGLWQKQVQAGGMQAVTPPPPDAYGKVVEYIKANPNVEYHPFQSIIRTPLSATDQVVSDVAGSAPGAFAANFANAATAGLPVAAAGDQGAYFQQASGQQHPTASMLGDLAGSTAGMIGGEAALGKAGMKAGLGRELVANAGYGAVRGGAENPDNPVGGALGGAAAAAGGTIVGRGVAKGVGGLIAPSGGSMNALFGAGVRPTPGQRFANSGLAGRALNATEEALQSLPVTGAAIHGARQEARDQFQVGAFNQALGELRGIKGLPARLPSRVGPGTQAHAFTQRVFDKAYNDVRSQLTVAADTQLAGDLSNLSQHVGTLAQPSIDRFNKFVQDQVVRRVQNSGGTQLSGDAYKDVQAQLGKTIRGIRNSQSGDGELADALTDLQHVLDSAARRHSNPGAVEQLDKVDKGYAKFVRIEDAAKRGGVAKEAGTFSPNDFAAAVKSNGGRVRSKAYSQGEALMQDYADQGKGLSDKMGNSFTTDRALAAGTVAAAGAGYVEPTSLGLMAVLGAAYAPGGRRVLKGMVTPRGGTATRIGNSVKTAAPIAGAVGAALPSQ